ASPAWCHSFGKTGRFRGTEKRRARVETASTRPHWNSAIAGPLGAGEGTPGESGLGQFGHSPLEAVQAFIDIGIFDH
ncbi:hypothetical protein SB767_36515, partial [Bacillus sp. SIMBA_069]